jgi:hypothetical protein
VARAGAREGADLFHRAGQSRWFRIEATGDKMLERANFMSEQLKKAAGSGSGVDVGVDFDTLTVGDPPHQGTFNLVRCIQIRA